MKNILYFHNLTIVFEKYFLTAKKEILPNYKPKPKQEMSEFLKGQSSCKYVCAMKMYQNAVNRPQILQIG